MADRYIIQSGGATSGSCTTFGTAGTLAYVMGSTSPVVAGDRIIWCAGAGGASYDITSAAQILVRFATGTSWTAPVTVQGANSSGVIDGTKPEIKATGTWSTNISFFIIGTDGSSNPIRYVVWNDIDFNANDLSYNVINNSGITGTGAGTNTTAYYHRFNRCRFRKSKHNGLSLFTGGVGTEVDESFIFSQCEVSGCGIIASGSAGIGRGSNAATWVMDRCTVTGNENGIQLLAASDKVFTVIGGTFGSTTSGSALSSTQMKINAYGCTFGGSASAGLAFTTTGAGSTIERCRFIDNAGAGISDAGWDGTATVSPYNRNLFDGNGTNFEDVLAASITPPGTGNVFARNFPVRRGATRR